MEFDRNLWLITSMAVLLAAFAGAAALRRRVSPEQIGRVFSACIWLGIAAVIAAYVHVAPQITNLIALFALTLAIGVKRGRPRPGTSPAKEVRSA